MLTIQSYCIETEGTAGGALQRRKCEQAKKKNMQRNIYIVILFTTLGVCISFASIRFKFKVNAVLTRTALGFGFGDSEGRLLSIRRKFIKWIALKFANKPKLFVPNC